MITVHNVFVTSYCTLFASTRNFRIDAHAYEQFEKGDCYRREISGRCYRLQRSIYNLFEQKLVTLQTISIKSFYVFVLEFNFC